MLNNPIYIPKGTDSPYIVDYRTNFRSEYGDFPNYYFRTSEANMWFTYDVNVIEIRDENNCLDTILLYPPTDANNKLVDDVIMIIK